MVRDCLPDVRTKEFLMAVRDRLKSLPSEHRARLSQYVQGDEAGQRAVDRLVRRGIGCLPKRMRPGRLLPSTQITSTALANQVLAELHEASGRVFYGYRSDPRHVLEYELLAEYLPDCVTADTFKLAVEVEERWTNIKAKRYFPPPGGIAIEGGCYTGLKAMKWSDLLGPSGRVVAVEIDAMNFELLCRNVEANDLGEKIKPVHCGLWNEDGTSTFRHSHGRRNFLTTTDYWKREEERESTVPTFTIDTLIEQHDLPYVDYVNIQVNGAELEVLEGISRQLDNIKVLGIAAYYTIDGVKNSDRVQTWANTVGWKVDCVSQAGRVTLVNPKYAQEVASWPSKRREQ